MTPDTRGWHSWSFLYAIVSFGFSQIFLNMVQVNPAAFPASIPFVAWTLIWIQAIPLGLLLLLDRIFRRILRPWHAVLVALLAISLLKQMQVFHEAAYARRAGFIHPAVLYSIAATASLLLVGFWKRAADMVKLYLAYAGLCAVALPLIFIHAIYTVSAGSRDTPLVPAACGAGTPSVYMIIFDELSLDLLMKDGHIDKQVFPHFAALAGDSLWFRNATTNHWSTIDSVPTILSGKIQPGPEETLHGRLPAAYKKTIMLTEIEVENWMRRAHSENDLYRGKAHFLNWSPVAVGEFIGYRLWGFFTFQLPQNILFDDPEFHVTLKQEERSFLRAIHRSGPQFLVWHCSMPHSPFMFTENRRTARPKS